MKAVNIHEAKTHLSRLIGLAAQGETTIIAKAGKPVAKIVPFDAPETKPRRFGFLKGRIQVPDDFDRMGQSEIDSMFSGDA